MKRIFTFGLLVAAAFALTNCAQKESYAPVQEDTKSFNFELVVNLPAETKTINDGVHTKWEENDEILVTFSSKIGIFPYSSNAKFTTQGDGKFTGQVSMTTILGDIINGFGYANITATYPSDSKGVPEFTTQSEYGSMAHLAKANCPLYGELTNAHLKFIGQDGACVIPELPLEHTTSVIEVAVKNSTAAAINVNEVDFLVGDEVKATTVVEKAGALAAGETAKVYIVVEPGTYSNLSFTVNDSFVKTINAAEATFTAGKIKKVNFEVK